MSEGLVILRAVGHQDSHKDRTLAYRNSSWINPPLKPGGEIELQQKTRNADTEYEEISESSISA
ncbi:MAG TPA: hypothetical protein V6D10_18185 [Trichocoleus sp.]|jgi:hypothetical protein